MSAGSRSAAGGAGQPAARRVRMSPDARRAQLITLGVEMLATRTLDDVSVEDIAAQAGISRGLLFHYFTSKQDFQLAVAEAAAAAMLRRSEPDTTLAPMDALRQALDGFVGYVEESPETYTSLIRGAASADNDLRVVFDRTRDAMAQRVLDILASLGVELSAEAELSVHGWIGFVESSVIRWLTTRDASRENVLDMLTKALPALVLSASGVEQQSIVEVLASDLAIGTPGSGDAATA